MKMFKNTKFIFSYAECEKFYLLEEIHHYEMFECLYRSILGPAQGCKFINNVETVIFHSINCLFYFYIAHYVNHYAMCQF